MKNTYSPSFPPPPRPSPSPNVDISGSNPNLIHSSPEVDHNRYRSWPRRERAGFVKSIRKTSSQLFKKDKKDGDGTLRRSPSAISILVSGTLNVSTAHTTPNILHRFSRSHSKRLGATSVITVNWDPPEKYLEVEGGGGGSIHSPTVGVTSVPPATTEPLDPVPTNPSEKMGKEDTYPETASEDPNPLFLSLPPSPPCPPYPLMDLVDPIQPPDYPRGRAIFPIRRSVAIRPLVIWPSPTSHHDRYRPDNSIPRSNYSTHSSTTSTVSIRRSLPRLW